MCIIPRIIVICLTSFTFLLLQFYTYKFVSELPTLHAVLRLRFIIITQINYKLVTIHTF